MMHEGQTHIKRNCFSIGIISSNYKVGVTGAGGAVLLSDWPVERWSDGGHLGSAGGACQDRGVRPPVR
jgi:hypothetical protein